MLNHDKMPGAGSVGDTIEFMKKMWSSMGAPAMATPSLSVEDINKKITDLKTVASWLELNLNMLKATIQTLEVQSATLSTLQAMSAIMASRGTPAAEAADDQVDDAEQEPAAAPPFPFGFPLWPGAAPAEAASEAAEAGEAATPEAEPEPAVAQDSPPDAAAAPQPPEAGSPGAADFQSAIANPNAWWNVLQEQFKHAVGNALAGAQADHEPLLKPAKAPRPAKRSENKTVPPKSKGSPKAKPAGAPKAGKVAKAAPRKPPVKKAPKSAANTSAPARTGVVQSRQNKKPASRKPTSP
ncbi:MAG TPA: PhaM family polyhydroxyalkanoate granule multifunctional regulatory protein [Herbaspirillum sp.]|uniref:PhaM family polyhydroxyalkanoate granule multifunctional regulatory protein n=1 Tax=Herbaspirillum sp. TaxID=1890675 RepID=UPI002D5473E5|nr:PhaM family polyhydroxyalkanoate granule multifunctional regulatory protein [Herbaspirillum sp.]HZG20408.1 PhaM family polyhydroxyalkanoate granule multifunctional regulatory protein [Herbaspirillum sp.]